MSFRSVLAAAAAMRRPQTLVPSRDYLTRAASVRSDSVTAPWLRHPCPSADLLRPCLFQSRILSTTPTKENGAANKKADQAGETKPKSVAEEVKSQNSRQQTARYFLGRVTGRFADPSGPNEPSFRPLTLAAQLLILVLTMLIARFTVKSVNNMFQNHPDDFVGRPYGYHNKYKAFRDAGKQQ